MRRTTCLAYFGSLLIFSRASLGCANEEYVIPEGPGVTDVVPPPQRSVIVAPSRDELIARWQLPSSSPWLPYEKLTLPSVLAETPEALTMPSVDDLDGVRLAHVAGARVAADGLPDDAAWFVDLQGAASVAFAWSLARYSRATIAAIPTFNNWPADNELVPAEETLAAMIATPPRLPAEDDVGARPVFLLDAWRLAYKDETIDEGTLDNRYMLTPADFPSAAVLREQGITQIVYVVGSDDILDEEDDLNEVFAQYEEAGITISLVDLHALSSARAGWAARYLQVRRRATVVHDPRFYRRSHGGFGGAHLVPTLSGYGRGGMFHGGG